MRLDTPDLAEYLSEDTSGDTRVPELIAERDRLQKSLEALSRDFYTDQLITRDEFFAARDGIQGRLRVVGSEVDLLRTQRFKLQLASGETVRAAWEARGDKWRREVFEVLIEKVVIHKGSRKPFYFFDGKRTRLDVERVEIIWKA